MALAVERSATLGAPNRPPIVLLHGFTQNARCWGQFGQGLRSQGDVIAVDLPGHGLSHHDDADLDGSASLVADVIAGLDEPPLVIGYSMGGRIALHLALADPDRVGALVLIGATGGLDDHDERVQRRQADAALAERLLADGLEAFLDRWLALPLFADLDDTAAARTERLTNRAEGLAASLRNCGTGTQRALWAELDSVTVPTLCIAGADDDKFIGLGERLVASIGSNAQLAKIEDAGHACHLAASTATLDAISAAGFLSPPHN